MITISCKVCEINIEVPNRRTKMCVDCSHQKKLERCSRYKANNKEKIMIYNKKYKLAHKDEISEYNKKYNTDNRQEIQMRQTIQHRERRHTDMNYKISIAIRNRISKFRSISGFGSIKNIIGCSIQDFTIWLEHNFTKNMSWENYGTYWHIDHVILCEIFDLTNMEEIKLCFNWKNMRPLLAVENISRRKLLFRDFLFHELKVQHYLKNNKERYDDMEYNWQLVTKLQEKSCNGFS